MAGVLSIEYVPLDWINKTASERIYSPGYDLASAIVLSQGNWLTLPLLIKKKDWRESMKSTKQGEYFDLNINGTTPKLRPAVSGEFMKMRGRRFILRGTDANAQTWLLGTIEHPLQFSVSGKTGPIGGANNYAIRFVGKVPEMAAGYNF